LLLLLGFCWLFQNRMARDKQKDLGPFYIFENTNKYKLNGCKHIKDKYKTLGKYNFHWLKRCMVMNHRNRLHFTLVSMWDFWVSVQQMVISSFSVLYFLTFLLLHLGVHIKNKKLSWWCLLLLFISSSMDLWPQPLCRVVALTVAAMGRGRSFRTFKEGGKEEAGSTPFLFLGCILA